MYNPASSAPLGIGEGGGTSDGGGNHWDWRSSQMTRLLPDPRVSASLDDLPLAWPSALVSAPWFEAVFLPGLLRAGGPGQVPRSKHWVTLAHGSRLEHGGPLDSGRLPTCRDSLGVTLDPAAFPSAEILALISGAAQAMVTRPLVQPFYATGRQNPIAGERCYLAGCCQGRGFVHIRAWGGFKARLTINSSVWWVLPFVLQKHWALTCQRRTCFRESVVWVTKESIRKQRH